MVYVTSDDPEDSTTRKLEEVVFKAENLGVGAKFFDTVKMTAGDVAQDRLLKDVGRSLPRIVLLSRDYKVADVLEGKQLVAGKIVRAMKSVARKEFKTNFDRMIKDYIKLLNERDRLEGRKRQIDDNEARLKEKPNRSKEKKLARMRAEFEKDSADWEEREKKLLTFEKKEIDPKA